MGWSGRVWAGTAAGWDWGGLALARVGTAGTALVGSDRCGLPRRGHQLMKAGTGRAVCDVVMVKPFLGWERRAPEICVRNDFDKEKGSRRIPKDDAMCAVYGYGTGFWAAM